VVVVIGADRALARDHGVRVLVGTGEHGRERGLGRVGEDVGAAHHRHPQHHRDRRQAGAELAAEQSFERDARHDPRPLITSSTWFWLAPVSSLEISPSARNRIRSAITAARASWVTITMVCW